MRFKYLFGCSLLLACSATSSKLKNKHPNDLEMSGVSENLFDSGLEQESSSCITTFVKSETKQKPVDIIFVVDNSGSMSDEITGISKNINVNFAQVMDKSNIDYRVIVLSEHSSAQLSLCIEEPLSTIKLGDCANVGDGPGAIPPGINPGKFYQYSYEIDSNNSPCKILDTLVGNGIIDDFGLAPNGWSSWLRKEAFKVFIEITDDMPMCVCEVWNKKKKTYSDFGVSLGGKLMAIEFDKALTERDPDNFGTPEARNYSFYSIVGLANKNSASDADTGLPIDPSALLTDPYLSTDGVTEDMCNTAWAPGLGYQWLSKITNGLRFPVCQSSDFSKVFKNIANNIAASTSINCEFKITDTGLQVDYTSIKVTLSSGSYQKELKEVSGEWACISNNEYYVSEATGTIILCGDTCKEIKKITNPKLFLNAGCEEFIK